MHDVHSGKHFIEFLQILYSMQFKPTYLNIPFRLPVYVVIIPNKCFVEQTEHSSLKSQERYVSVVTIYDLRLDLSLNR